jgi:hypothetical protein
MCLTGGVGWSFVGATAAQFGWRFAAVWEFAAASGGYGDGYWCRGGDTSCA